MESDRLYALPAGTNYQTSGSHSGGAIGPLFVVLAIIVILGVVAGLVSRVCSGRHWGGDTEYDFEGWVEHRCASCIDGDVEAGGGCDAKAAENGTVAPPPQPAEAGAAEPKPADEGNPAEGAAEAKPAEGGGGDEAAGGGGEAAAPAEEAKPAEGDCGEGC
eukprot:c23441_g2_i1 orf=573-1055(-)